MDNLLSLVDFPKLDRYVLNFYIIPFFRHPWFFKSVVPLFKRILLPKDTVFISQVDCQLSTRTLKHMHHKNVNFLSI
jgi:hypothetical protein